jgi:glycosyltransferase involved in cell wall biosynthesis
MKLLIDFQACQAERKTRGIGRYAFGLLKAMAEMGKLANATLHLNATLSGANDPLLREILALSPRTQVVCENYLPMNVPKRDRNRELNVIKFSNIASDYDGVFFIDPMEAGNTNFTPVSKNSLCGNIWCGAIIHDLIPMIFRDFYLTSQEARHAYYRKLQLIRSCDCLLSNSEHTKKDVINLLEIHDSKIFNISGGVDFMFKTAQCSKEYLSPLAIEKNFLMHLGGMDPRKNTLAVIKAFELLPHSLKKHYQLLIVCENNGVAEHLTKKTASSNDISTGDLIFTGFIPDDTLIKLYSAATLFVFPSLYEGLGLPILEAIRCGAPVLAGDNSSQPEVVGTEDALFDASSPQSIADKIAFALNNPDWLRELQTRQSEHAKKFTWTNTAERTWNAMESSFSEFRRKTCRGRHTHIASPKLAWFTPLPPEKTGIANYNAKLLPHMSRDFDVSLVIDDGCSVTDEYLRANYPILSVAEFEANNRIRAYDQCVYQMGNSHFHAYMFPLMEKYGGVIVMHEVYMDGLAELLETQTTNSPFAIVCSSNHYTDAPKLQIALFPRDSEEFSRARTTTFLQHLANLSDGILVHSKHAIEMLETLAPSVACPIAVAGHGTSLPILPADKDKKRLRKTLCVEEDKIICSIFGNIQKFKGIEDIVGALCELGAISKNITFLFVGACIEGHEKWFEELLLKASSAGIDARATGYVDDARFLEYVDISDFALSLRTVSRGESSGALLHLMSRGVPSIVYDIGFFSEVDNGAVVKVPLSDISALKSKIELLAADKGIREKISAQARDYAGRFHWSTRVDGYREIIYRSMEYRKRAMRYVCYSG